MSTTPVTLDPQNTSLEAAQANSMAAAKDTCARMNSNLQIIYLGAFNNWKISVDAGRIDNTNPPKPPVGYVVVTGPDGFSYPELGTAAVCDMPPIPADCSKPQPTVLPAPKSFLSPSLRRLNRTGPWT